MSESETGKYWEDMIMKATIIGRRYSDVATYWDWDAAKRWPNYEKVEEQEWTVDVSSLKDGERWLAVNHPDMYMGGSVVMENGDFMMMAVPCVEYGDGNYETEAARVACVKEVIRFDEIVRL